MIRSITLLISLFLLGMQCSAQELAPVNMPADSPLALHIQALGGREALASIHDRTMEAMIEGTFHVQPQEASFKKNVTPHLFHSKGIIRTVQKYPGKSYTISMMNAAPSLVPDSQEPSVFEMWNNGDIVKQSNASYKRYSQIQGWDSLQILRAMQSVVKDSALIESTREDIANTDTPVMILQGKERARALERDQFNECLRLKEPGYTVDFAGMKMFDGRFVYTLKITKPYSIECWLIDCRTYLLTAKYSPIHPDDPESYHSIERYSDYHLVDGIQLPFTIATSMENNACITYHVQSYYHNTNPSDEIFEKDD